MGVCGGLVGLLIAISSQRSSAQDDGLKDVISPEDVAADTAWIVPVQKIANARNSSGLLYERWEGVRGRETGMVRDSELLHQQPNRLGVIGEARTAENDGRDYLTRLRGVLVSPRSGKGRLAICSDGCSELWISQNDLPFAKKLVAWVRSGPQGKCPKPGQYLWSRSQWSEEIDFEKGKSYYIEVVHKSDRGKDHLSVGWGFDGFKDVEPLPVDALRPWAGSSKDVDDDGLADDWQLRTGIAGKAKRAAWQDFDGDGVTNLEEYANSTDPCDGGAMKGFLLWEIWDGILGHDVADLVRTPAFRGPADRCMFVGASVTPKIKCGDFGSRLSGFIAPPESGTYELAVSGDSSTELWFSRSESRLLKERIAFSPHWRQPGEWEFLVSQRSAPITLEAGKSYYFEVLHKDMAAPGWAGVAWRRSGEKAFMPIAPQFLRSPAVEQEDLDRDYLSDGAVSGALERVPEEMRERTFFTQFGDPDRDGLPNWLEDRLGTPMFERNSVAERWTKEWWFLQPGNSLERARREGAWLRRPSMTALIDPMDSRAGANFYVSRMRAMITPRVPGRYRFFVAADDQCELWMSTDRSKFNKRMIASILPKAWESEDTPVWTPRTVWDKHPAQCSSAMVLEEGVEYFVEVLHKEGSGDDHVEVGWQRFDAASGGWSAVKRIPASAIQSFEGDPNDLDDDCLPDDWEKQYGLDTSDNGERNFEKQGEIGDFDLDGITNREEYLAGTNPAAGDTDGDGVGDLDEIRLYGSDPTTRDASKPVKVADLNLELGKVISGSWNGNGEGWLISNERRGIMEFDLNLKQPGIYKVTLSAIAYFDGEYVPPVPLVASVDGWQIGSMKATGGEGSVQGWLTPWLGAGRHRIRIENRNQILGVTLVIRGVSVFRHEGTDQDANGIPDWLAHYFSLSNTLTTKARTSRVSPVCIEGFARFPFQVSVVAGGTSTMAAEALTGQWYANVPLNPDRPKEITVRFEKEAVSQSLEIEWTATNLFDVAGPLWLRVGDSLKVHAVPSGTQGEFSGILSQDGKVLQGDSPDVPRVIRFDQPGAHTVSASVKIGAEQVRAEIQVFVFKADFGPPFSVAAGTPRIWKLPGVDAAVELESDPMLLIEGLDATASGVRQVRVTHHGDADSPRVVGRVPGVGIIASTSVASFRVVDSARTLDAHVIDVLPDGTRVVEVGFVIDGPIPPDLSLWIELYVADAVFANGATRYELTAGDFDKNGIARLRIYKAPGDGVAAVCHWIRPFEDDEDSPGPASE
jgi:hypothetical protein